MSIKPLRLETIFSGGIHLLWLTLLTLKILGESPDIILSYLSQMGSGTAVFLIALLFSFAFFIGRIAEHFLSALNYLCKPDERQEYANAFEGSKGGAWANKIFSLSATVGLLFFGICLWIVSDSGNIKIAILVIGLILLTGTISSFLYWFKLGKKLNQRQDT